MKHGFIYEPLTSQDCSFGSSWDLSKKGFKGVQLVPDGNWEPYLFDLIESHQAPGYETNSCVSHGTANAIELLKNRVYEETFDLSDRFIAKMSNTDPATGNTPKRVADSIRHDWSPQELEWPTDEALSLQEFYKEIPHEIILSAKGQKGTTNFGYERVDPVAETMKEALKYSPLGISCYLVPGPNGKYYKPVGVRDGHWLVLLHIREDGKFVLLDSYAPFIKIAEPFRPEMAMRYALDYKKYNAFYESTINLLKKFLSLLQDYLAVSVKKKEIPPIFPIPKTTELYNAAFAEIGNDLSEQAPDERGCAEAASKIIKKVYPNFPIFLSTIKLNEHLRTRSDFFSSANPITGCIGIFPTEGAKIGHVGIWGRKGWVMSNNSGGTDRGKWTPNYTDFGFKEEAKKRGLRMYYYIPQ